MASNTDSDARRSDERQRPLIEAVSLETAIANARAWSARNEQITASLKALNQSVIRVQQLDFGGATLAVPRGTPGAAPLDSPSAAVTAADAARSGIQGALKARDDARAALAEACREAEGTLQQAGDVKVARWAIGTVAVLLLAVLLTVLFYV